MRKALGSAALAAMLLGGACSAADGPAVARGGAPSQSPEAGSATPGETPTSLPPAPTDSPMESPSSTPSPPAETSPPAPPSPKASVTPPPEEPKKTEPKKPDAEKPDPKKPQPGEGKADPEKEAEPKGEEEVPDLRMGSEGPAVTRLQKRLAGLRYLVPEIDGIFGEDTLHAVMAFQKVHKLTADGVVGPRTRRALRRPITPYSRDKEKGLHVEVNLNRQVVYFFRGREIVRILDTSTGNGETFTNESGSTVVAHTPTGHFEFYRSIDGLRVSYLGELWRPWYFYGGYAVHGSPSVPAYPASHGCVRLTFTAMDWAFGRISVGPPVFVYGDNPEPA